MNHSIKRFFLTILLCTVALPLVAQTQSLPRAKASAKMDVAFEEYLKAAADAKQELHSVMVVKDGKAVLCLGESGTGKSTHTRLWRENIEGAHLLNDDSPILRVVDGTPYAYEDMIEHTYEHFDIHFYFQKPTESETFLSDKPCMSLHIFASDSSGISDGINSVTE